MSISVEQTGAKDISNNLGRLITEKLMKQLLMQSKYSPKYINQRQNVDLFHQLEVAKTKPKDGQTKFSQKQGDAHNQKMLEINISHSFKNIRYGIWINPNLKPNFRHKPIDFGETMIQVEVPKPMLTWQLVMRVVWYDYDIFATDAYNKDFIVGGVLDVSCFNFMPLPKEEIKSWMIKYDYTVEDSLQKIQYPSLDATGPLSIQNAHPVKVFYTLPPNFFLKSTDLVKVAAYDPKNGWTHDYIEDIKYDAEKKLLTFTSLRLAPLAFVQDRCTDFPYTSWKLRCVEEQKAILDVVGKRETLRFEIGTGYVILKDRPEPELSHLSNKKFQPGTLLHELYKCGINMMPTEKDAEASNITRKSFEAELKAIVDICFAVSGFFIKSSKWNMATSSDKILLRIRENLEYDLEFAEDQEKDWKSIMFWEDKCTCVRAKDSSEHLDDKPLKDVETHSNLEILLREHELTVPEALDRMKNLEYIGFIDTLKRFLKLTRILGFTLN